MAPNRGRNRAGDFDNLLDPMPADFDPEADDVPDNDSESEDDLDGDLEEDGSREHYVDVGKSKLRKPKEALLGPQYRGSKVGRDAVEQDEEDDPFSRGFDDDDSEDEGGLDGESVSSGGDVDDSEEGDEEDETPDTDASDDEEAGPRPDSIAAGRDRAELLEAVASEQKTVAASLSQANRADAEKGRAVKKQRTAFDFLLGTRMKLQKTLIDVNTLAGTPEDAQGGPQQDASGALEAAEAAAFNLWSSLNSFREEMIAAKTGQKRKRSNFTSATPTSKLWSHMQHQEDDSLSQRNATLQKWSAKARGVTATPQRNRLNNTEYQATIMDVIQEQLSNSDRLMKRAHTPRSCAPLQVANKVTEDERIYDDADFYGLMLKELLEQKSHDSVAASNIDVSFQMRRDAKTKKNVDTKASKGRKLRYTVHEKLQNFMAPEDRSTWGERQTDELFGSLFGQRLGLGEEREDDINEDMGDGIDHGEASLMLFRS